MSQLVMVALLTSPHDYTYEWSGDPPLTIGEEVMLPMPDGEEGWMRGMVVQLNSTYTGRVKSILGRAPERKRA